VQVVDYRIEFTASIQTGHSGIVSVNHATYIYLGNLYF